EPISTDELSEAALAENEILEQIVTEEDRERFLTVVEAILTFTSPKGSRVGSGSDPLKAFGRRVLALAWTIDPSLIEESPSLAAIAKAIGCTRAALSVHSAQAHRHFGIRRSRGQCHAWNFKEVKAA